MTALYNVPKGSRVKIAGTEMEFEFHHIDGMYSYCKDDNGSVFHLAAWTDVEVIRTPNFLGDLK